MQTQRQRTDFLYLRVGCQKQADDLRRQYDGRGAYHHQHAEAEPDAEPERPTDPLIQACPIIKSANGLKALSKTNDGTHRHHHHAGNDAHGRNGRISIATRGQVEAHGGPGC